MGGNRSQALRKAKGFIFDDRVAESAEMMVPFAKRCRRCKEVYQQDMHLESHCCMPSYEFLPPTHALSFLVMHRRHSIMVASVRHRRPLPPDSDHVLPSAATATSTTKALDDEICNDDDEDEEGRLERCKACAVCGKPNGKACVKCTGSAFYCDKDCHR